MLMIETMTYEQYKNRVLELSKKHGLSHIGSNLSMYPLFEEIYSKKNNNDLVVFDNAHCGLGHLVVKEEEAKEAYELGMGAKFDADEMLKYGIHCDREAGCDATGGSLGHGLGISIGLALAHKDSKVYCTISDGSIMEGSNWEALRLINDLNIKNIEIHANFNGYTAVAEINRIALGTKLYAFNKDIKIHHTNNGEGFDGIQGHYVTT